MPGNDPGKVENLDLIMGSGPDSLQGNGISPMSGEILVSPKLSLIDELRGTMHSKKQILLMLRKEFARWEELLATMSEKEITDPFLPSIWSIKDVIAHLMAWQQISIARMEAARAGTEPLFPTWVGGSDPESEHDLELINGRIYETYKDQAWSSVHRDWREGFLWFLALGEEIAENDILDPDRYPWLKGNPLFAVLQGSYEHHQEHMESILAAYQ
jgi:hypothetical protein